MLDHLNGTKSTIAEICSDVLLLSWTEVGLFTSIFLLLSLFLLSLPHLWFSSFPCRRQQRGSPNLSLFSSTRWASCCSGWQYSHQQWPWWWRPVGTFDSGATVSRRTRPTWGRQPRFGKINLVGKKIIKNRNMSRCDQNILLITTHRPVILSLVIQK